MAHSFDFEAEFADPVPKKKVKPYKPKKVTVRCFTNAYCYEFTDIEPEKAIVLVFKKFARYKQCELQRTPTGWRIGEYWVNA